MARCLPPIGWSALHQTSVDLEDSAGIPQECRHRHTAPNRSHRCEARKSGPAASTNLDQLPVSSSSSTTTAESLTHWRPRIPGPPVVSRLEYAGASPQKVRETQPRSVI